MHRVVASIVASLALLMAACGGGDKTNEAPAGPIRNVPNAAGIRDRVKQASVADKSDFPAPDGKSLQDLANGMAAGPSLAMASSIFTTPGATRMAFGMVGKDGLPVYGPTAIYVAPTPDAPAEGPFVAPADVLLTAPRYRSKQAATTQDPFVAVYSAQVKFPKHGQYAVLATTKTSDGKLTGATGQVQVSTASADPIPRVGDKAPVVHTDTVASAKGDIAKIDTRDPPSDMHEVDFAD